MQIDEDALTHSRCCRLARHASQQNDDVPPAGLRSHLQWVNALEVQRRYRIYCDLGPLKPAAYQYQLKRVRQLPGPSQPEAPKSPPPGLLSGRRPPCLAQFPPPGSSGSLSSGHHTTWLHHHHPSNSTGYLQKPSPGTISLDEPARPSFRTASSTSFGLPGFSPSLLPIHSSNRISTFQTTKSIAMREVISINGMGSATPSSLPLLAQRTTGKATRFCSPLPTTHASSRPDTCSCTL